MVYSVPISNSYRLARIARVRRFARYFKRNAAYRRRLGRVLYHRRRYLT